MRIAGVVGVVRSQRCDLGRQVALHPQLGRRPQEECADHAVVAHVRQKRRRQGTSGFVPRQQADQSGRCEVAVVAVVSGEVIIVVPPDWALRVTPTPLARLPSADEDVLLLSGAEIE